ncbi:MAG: hypothetical protein GY705_16820, partial [Bacteroidetes bacterium]|nr:hypothetical protein [Bacteroidota bacterium]
MKKIITLCLLVSAFFSAIAQNCTPDPNYVDEPAGVYPVPYHPDSSPDGGITEIACIGQPYEFTFTSVSDEFVFNGNSYVLDSFVLTGVQGLPDGLSFFCGPPNCVLYFGEAGCMVISGTPSETNIPGDYPLTITGTAFLQGLFSLDLTFPNENIYPGDYIITLEAADSPNCTIYDCPDIQANIGDSCDDGDPNTTGETIQNDCSCAGG